MRRWSKRCLLMSLLAWDLGQCAGLASRTAVAFRIEGCVFVVTLEMGLNLAPKALHKHFSASNTPSSFLFLIASCYY